MKKNILKILLLWLIAEIVIWVPYHELIGYNKLLTAGLYFFAWSTVTVFLFKDLFKRLFTTTEKRSYLLVVAILAFHLGVYWFCNQFLGEPTELIKNNSASFILVNKYFLFIKPIDILLQQLMIIVLITKLHHYKMSIRAISFSLALVFGATHVYGMQHMEILPTLILTVAATAMSVAFPYLLLKVKNGYLYNFMLHVVLVDLGAILFWSLY